jgi:hypothetical protein
MGIEAYRVRASRLVKHLASRHGLNLTTSDGLVALAAQEGIPRADWNVLAAMAKTEPRENDSELVIGESGSGKSVFAKNAIVSAFAFERPTLIVSAKGEYEQVVEALGGTIHTALPDGGVEVKPGHPGLVLFTWDGLRMPEMKAKPTWKSLGFQKPALREVLVVLDEVHQYADHGWLLDMVGQIAGNEAATTLILAQMVGESNRVAPMARVRNARLFRSREITTRDHFAADTVGLVENLRMGESVVRPIRFFTAECEISDLWEKAPDDAQTVLRTTHGKIHVREEKPMRLRVALPGEG